METKRGRDNFQKYKSIFLLISNIVMLIPYKLRLKIFNNLRSIKGLKGIGLRYVFLKGLAKEIGDNVSIHTDVYIFNPNNLSIGNNVSIHPMSYIEAKGGITIGDDVSIAHAVTILSVNHNYSDKNIPIKNQGINFKETIIMNDVWIGAKASILAGTKVSEGTIVATGAIVTKDTISYAIVGGVPASVIKLRH